MSKENQPIAEMDLLLRAMENRGDHCVDGSLLSLIQLTNLELSGDGKFYSPIRYLEAGSSQTNETEVFSREQVFELINQLDGVGADELIVVERILRSEDDQLVQLTLKTTNPDLKKLFGNYEYYFVLKGKHDDIISTGTFICRFQYQDNIYYGTGLQPAQLPANTIIDPERNRLVTVSMVAVFDGGNWLYPVAEEDIQDHHVYRKETDQYYDVVE